MKKLLFLLCAAFTLFSTNAIFAAVNEDSQLSVAAARIGETTPSSSAYVFGTGEQLIGQAFQQDALLTYKGYQYTVYYNTSRNVCIARRKMPAGNWEEVVLSYKNSQNDAHNVISMGICANDGSIHLSYDHHNSPLHYCYSISGSANDPENMVWDASSFSATTSEMETGVAVADVTYPRFINKPDGNLLFECRYGLSGNGDSYLREYDGTTKKWSYIGRYVQGRDASPDVCAYINRMDYDVKGRLHVSWCWREDFGGQSNKDIYYGYSDDNGRTWKDKDGNQVAVTENIQPTYDTTPGACMRVATTGLKIKTIPKNKGYINQESQTSDSKGQVHIINSYIDGDGTDSNWAESRKKAVLHHHFIDETGTLHHNLVKKNGQPVNSYCRTQIVADAFDNMYVIANGAEVYVATPENDYTDWELLSDTDLGRFISEPQVDRPLLLKEGILSFVYLGADNKVTVIDYLLDNPQTPNGTGLKAEYFSDDNFTNLLDSEDNVEVDASILPAEAQSVRWSGTFETVDGGVNTLYITTSEETNVYVNGVHVLMTKKTSSPQEYSFNYPMIASQKNDIRIESKSTQSTPISFSWSSSKTAKTSVPVTSLYPESRGIDLSTLPKPAPTLKTKNSLSQTLLENKSINSSDKEIYNIKPFEPEGDYSIEIKAKINAVTGRGMDIQARNTQGKGFRLSLGESMLKWTAPLADPEQLSVSDNATEQTIRVAISGDNAYVYQNKEIIAQKKITSIGDINGAEETMREPYTVEELGDDNLIKNPTFAGIENNGAPGGAWVSDGTMGGGTNPRVQVGNSSVPTSISPTQTAFTIRFDYSMATYFSYPVTLKPDTWYEHTVDVIAWGTGSDRVNKPVDVIISTSKEGVSGIAFKETMYTPGTGNTGEKKVFNFKTPANSDTQYYLTYRNTTGTSLVGITNLTFAERENALSFIIGKNYEGGSANMDIIYVKYEDGAYAPGSIDTPNDPNLPKKQKLSLELQGVTLIDGADGQKQVQTLSNFNPQGNYSIEVSATVYSADGRGLDIEARDAEGKGFRTSQNTSSFERISPFNDPLELSKSDNSKQIIRYAVTNDSVHIYRNELYIYSMKKQTIGDMNAAGTEETTPATTGAKLLFGKNYTTGNALIQIDYIRYDASGAYAPGIASSWEDEYEQANEVIMYSFNNTLTINSQAKISNVIIYDTMGRLFVNEIINAETFSTTLQKGFYIVKVNTTEGSVTKKVIVN